MSEIELPIFDWFIGDPFSKYGNLYVGSYGATSLSANAFCYQVLYDRSGEAPLFKCRCYDVISKNDDSSHNTAQFDGTVDGLHELKQWLDQQLANYIQEGRNKLVYKF